MAFTKDLLSSLEEIQSSKMDYHAVCKLLSNYSFEDFDDIFEISNTFIPSDSCLSFPIYSGKCIVQLKIWGNYMSSTIHDSFKHHEYIKVLTGSLTQVLYRENINFIELDRIHYFDDCLELKGDTNRVHSIINNPNTPSVTMHIHATSSLNYEGIRIFDTEKRRIGYLNANASNISWDLQTACYDKIVLV